MTALTVAEIGSVIINLVSNIPAGISGLLPTIVDQQRIIAQNLTGDTISSPITETYQPAITNLSISMVLKLMEGQGIGTQSVDIGELSVTKGLVNGTSKDFYTLGIEQLNDLGTKTSYYQCWG